MKEICIIKECDVCIEILNSEINNTLKKKKKKKKKGNRKRGGGDILHDTILLNQKKIGLD